MTVMFMSPEGHNHILHVKFHKELGLELCLRAFRPEPFSSVTFTIKFMYNIAKENSRDIILETAKLLPFITEEM